MRLSICLFLLFQLKSILLIGQDAPPFRNQFLIAAGATHYRVIDEAFTQSRFKFSGTSFTLGLGYKRWAAHHQVAGKVQFGLGRVSMKESGLAGDLYAIRLALSYLRIVGENWTFLGKETKVLVGPQIRATSYAMADEDILENVSVSMNYTFDLCLTQVLKLNDVSSIDLALALPLFGYTKRDSYDGGASPTLDDDSGVGAIFFRGGKASLLNPLHLPSLNIGYVRSIGVNTDLSLDYHFGYLRNNQKSSIRLYDNTVLIVLIKKF